MSVFRRSVTLVCALAITGAALPALAAPPDAPPGHIQSGRCVDNNQDAIPLTLQVGGEAATGHYALPDKEPQAIVVFAHGYGHSSYSWIHHMTRTARELDAIAVTMDYRGLKLSPDSNNDGLPESRGWNAMKGAEDLIAAAEYFEGQCKSPKRTVLLGVSMGGNMSGLALALSRKNADNPLFDHWIDVEGAVNVIETYAGARVLAPVNGFAKNAQQDIEAEMGGPIENNPAAYRERAVVTRIDEIKASGVKGVTVIHGLDDGLVPYNQGREMATLLLGAGIPTDMFTVGRRSKQSEKETTATGYAGDPLFAAAGQSYMSPLSGHASEKSTTHIIMVKAFERLAETVKGYQPTLYNEYFVDGELGTFGPTL
jgi:acetyl esterase/lipase